MSEHLHPTVREYVSNKAIADDYDSHFAGNELFEYDCEYILEHLPEPSKVLDLGCGTGRHMTFLGTLGYECVGVDLNPHMLQKARVNLDVSDLPAKLVQADFHRLPLVQDNSFSAALLLFSALGLIKHHKLRVALLKSLHHYLAPEGKVFAHFHNRAYNPSTGAFSKIASFVLSPAGDKIMRNYRGIQDLYLHTFTADEIVSLFKEAGFGISDFRMLNDARNGAYSGPDGRINSNGFLVCAQKL